MIEYLLYDSPFMKKMVGFSVVILSPIILLIIWNIIDDISFEINGFWGEILKPLYIIIVLASCLYLIYKFRVWLCKEGFNEKHFIVYKCYINNSTS